MALFNNIYNIDSNIYNTIQIKAMVQIICDLWVLTFGRVHFSGLSRYISKTLPQVFTYPSKQPLLTIFLHSSVVRALLLGCLGLSVRTSVGDIFVLQFYYIFMFEARYLMKWLLLHVLFSHFLCVILIFPLYYFHNFIS